MITANLCRKPPGRNRASRRKWKTTRWSRGLWSCSPRDKLSGQVNPSRDREGASYSILQRLQIRDQIVLLRVAEHVLIGRHPLPALIDPVPDIGVSHFFPIGHLVLLEEALQPRTHFLFDVIRVVAHRAGLEYRFALGGIAFAGGQHYLGTGGQANAQRQYAKSMHNLWSLHRSI